MSLQCCNQGVLKNWQQASMGHPQRKPLCYGLHHENTPVNHPNCKDVNKTQQNTTKVRQQNLHIRYQQPTHKTQQSTAVPVPGGYVPKKIFGGSRPQTPSTIPLNLIQNTQQTILKLKSKINTHTQKQ